MPSAGSPKRSPSGLHLALADRVSQLDSAQWQAATAGASWFFSREYLSMLEGVLPAAIEPRYALIGNASGPLAAVVLQWALLEGRNLLPGQPGVEVPQQRQEPRAGADRRRGFHGPPFRA